MWESHDFVNWSEPRAVDVASQIPGAGMAWAPEAYWDDVNKQYMVYWATASDADNKSGDRTNMYYSPRVIRELHDACQVDRPSQVRYRYHDD